MPNIKRDLARTINLICIVLYDVTKRKCFNLDNFKKKTRNELLFIRLSFTEEHERRMNAEMMANRAKEHMTRNDEQCKALVRYSLTFLISIKNNYYFYHYLHH